MALQHAEGRSSVCSAASNGSNVSDEDGAAAAEVAIEGVDLYGLKMTYYVVDEMEYRNGAPRVDPVFGEHQLEHIDRAFYFMGYVTQMPPSIRTYQLQGIWGEDLVQVYVANAALSTSRHTVDLTETHQRWSRSFRRESVT